MAPARPVTLHAIQHAARTIDRAKPSAPSTQMCWDRQALATKADTRGAGDFDYRRRIDRESRQRTAPTMIERVIDRRANRLQMIQVERRRRACHDVGLRAGRVGGVLNEIAVEEWRDQCRLA